MVIHFEASLTSDLNDCFVISSIAILKIRWGENSRNEKPRNTMWDKREVTAHSHMGQVKIATQRGLRAFLLTAKEGNMVSRCQV
jgi:hypothetical protein